MRALIIGCGNIGGMYDIQNSKYKSYAKSFSKLSIDFDIYDPDETKARIISKAYEVNIVKKLDDFILKKYNTFVIASPTYTHFEYLKKFIEFSPNLIICEKPISTNIEELNLLEKLYKQKNLRIFVNYQRRYQPKLIEFKKILIKKQISKNINKIVFTYQKGIHNNGSHGLDFLSFILNLNYEEIKNIFHQNTFDKDHKDPTSTGLITWKNIPISIIGIPFINFSHFNIDIYFEDELISLINGCNIIEFKNIEKNQFITLNPTETIDNCMEDSMLEVSKHITAMFNNHNLKDNFLDSIKLSKYICKSFI